MDLRIFIEPQQGASYQDQAALARLTEELGFDAFFRSDHLLAMGDVAGTPGPTDSWVTLGAIATETSRIRLGTLVTAATFRLPGPLAIAVAQVDAMSGGRVELGIGTGWYDDEHAAYGVPFPPLGERFERFEEQLKIISGLWHTEDGKRFSYDGRHHQLTDSPALPKPAQAGGPPIIIGGGGPRRTPRLVAAHAAEFNTPFMSLTDNQAANRRVDEACRSVGRDPDEVVRSAALVVCCGADAAEVARRANAIGREPDELRANGAAGTPTEVRDTLGRWSEAGINRIYLQVLDLADHDHLRLLAAEVLGV